MTAQRLSQLQREILTWIWDSSLELDDTQVEHGDLTLALAASPPTLSASLRNLEAKGLVSLHRSPGGRVKQIELTVAGQERARACWAESPAGRAQARRELQQRLAALRPRDRSNPHERRGHINTSWTARDSANPHGRRASRRARERPQNRRSTPGAMIGSRLARDQSWPSSVSARVINRVFPSACA